MDFRYACALLLLGCSALISPGEDRCATSSGCLDGQVCENQRCIAAAECDPSRREACNGVDDDCDTRIDEGLEATVEACNDVDDDCDGEVDEDVGNASEVCNMSDDDCDGRVDEGLGAALEVCNQRDDDCDGNVDEDAPDVADVCNNADDDCDGTVDEGVAESCNNVDDDCDGTVDEGDLCSGGAVCAGSCVVRTCDNDPALACASGSFCNTSVMPPRCEPLPPATCQNDSQCDGGEVCFDEAGVCIDETPFGAPCTSDASCGGSRFCAELSMVGISGRTCTTTCCTDDDCEGSAVCASRSSGARLCVPAARAGSALGAACSTMSECASGYCNRDGQCAPKCSRDEDCLTSQRCVFRPADDGGRVTGCERPLGPVDTFDECDFFACQHGLCVPVGGRSVCFEPCSAAGECSDGEQCNSIEFTFTGGVAQFLSICLPSEDRAAGESCTMSNECASNRCEAGVCVAPCCADTQCGNGTQCRPIRLRDQFPTFCVP